MDIDALIGLLAPDATLVADGGVAGAALRPIDGAERIVRALLNLAGRLSDLTILERTGNGQPGLVVQQDGVIVTVAAFDVEGDQIKRIWGVRNPDKLRPWTAAPSERPAGGGLRGGRPNGSTGSTTSGFIARSKHFLQRGRSHLPRSAPRPGTGSQVTEPLSNHVRAYLT